MSSNLTGITNRISSLTLRGVDQLVDRLVWDQEAVSSSLATPTETGSRGDGRPRLPWTQEIAGSNPAFPTTRAHSSDG